MKRIENSISFVFEPAKAYSERLAKSIDGLWKLKEVFDLLALPGPQRGGVAPAIPLYWYNNFRSSAGDRGFESNLGDTAQRP
jgi:hypothetical protein